MICYKFTTNEYLYFHERTLMSCVFLSPIEKYSHFLAGVELNGPRFYSVTCMSSGHPKKNERTTSCYH